jgi:3D (Asp-Asp-Asp) domain-containing protein
VHQKTLLVALSLLLPCAVADDKHKQPSGRSGKAKRFTAYAYSSGRLTSLGQKPVAGITIAADPKVLPMGSRVRISGAGAYSGVYRVGDVGSSIKGHKVDVFVRSLEEAKQFGRRTVEVTLLSIPRLYGRANRCKGCGNLEAKAIINADEARGSSSNSARSSVATRGT